MDQNQLNKNLLYSVIENNLDNALLYLDAGADVNFNDDYFNRTAPLLIAFMKNNTSMIKLLIARGANANNEDVTGESVFHSIAGLRKTSNLHLLVEAGANLNAANNYGVTPLTQFFIQKSNAKIIEKLLMFGANPDIKNNDDISMADEAQRLLNEANELLNSEPFSRYYYDKYPIELATLIVNAKNKIIPNCDLPENKVNESLLIAARNGHHKRIIDLLSQGANINYVDEDGNNALLLLAKNGSVPCLEILMQYKIDYLHVNKIGESALHISSLSGYLEFVKYLIKLGLDVNQKTKTNSTPIIYASRNTDVCVLKYLIECGADVSDKNDFGDTCFFIAIESHSKNCVEFLLKNGADVDQLNKYNVTPIVFASMCLGNNTHKSDKKRTKFIDVIELLSRYGANINIYDEINGDHVLKNIMCSKLSDKMMIDLMSKILMGSDDIDLDLKTDYSFSTSPIEFARKRELTGVVRIFEAYQEMAKLKNDIDCDDDGDDVIGL